MVEQRNERAEKETIGKNEGSHAASTKMLDEIFAEQRSGTTKGRRPEPGDIVSLDPIEWGGNDKLKKAISSDELKKDSNRVEIDPIERERHPGDRISDDELKKPCNIVEIDPIERERHPGDEISEDDLKKWSESTKPEK